MFCTEFEDISEVKCCFIDRRFLFFFSFFFPSNTAINLGVASPYICEAKCDDMQYKRKQSLIFILIKKKQS